MRQGDSSHWQTPNLLSRQSSCKGNQKWLLVVNNYDDLETVNLVNEFQPTHASGSIIITNRARDLRRLGKGLEIEEILPEDDIELLRKSAGTKIEEFERCDKRIDVSIIDGSDCCIYRKKRRYCHRTGAGRSPTRT